MLPLLKETNNKNLKFRIGDNVGISKYKNIFVKGNNPNWSEEVFVIKKEKKYYAVDICY